MSRAGREASVRLPVAVTGASSDGHGQLGGDPRQGMSPPALNILAAAQRVLVEKGFSGLTLRAIAQESGENSAMVQYYFGNKEGLVEAMIDSVFRDDQQDAAAAMSTVTREDRLPRFVDGLRTISLSRSFRVFFDILPYALRNESFRSRMARAYASYRQIKCGWLRDEREPATSGPEQADEAALLGVAELHDGGRRWPGHPGGHRRRLRHAPRLRRAGVHAAALAAGPARVGPPGGRRRGLMAGGRAG